MSAPKHTRRNGTTRRRQVPDRVPVAPEQRFSSDDPCPICGGGQDDPRGIGVRCHGFRSEDGLWVYCARGEYAGGLELNASSDTYTHFMGGGCRCGTRHDAELQPATHNGRRDSRPSASRVGTPIRYDIVDARGRVIARHGRQDHSHGAKEVWWEQPNGTPASAV